MTTETTPDPNELLTPSEVAAYLKVDPKTVTRWAQRGWLPDAVRTLGGHRRYRRGDVLAAIAAASQRPYGGAR